MAAASPPETPQVLEGAAAEVKIELTREVGLFIPCVTQHPVQRNPEIYKKLTYHCAEGCKGGLR